MKFDTKTSIIVAGAVITALLGYWMTSTLQTNDDVLVIRPQVQQNTKRIEAVEQWQQDWPTQGELSADVRQTKDIEFIKLKVNEMEEEIRFMKAQIRAIELDK